MLPLHKIHSRLSALYIHIPFCKQQCNYCNFHFSTLLRGKSEMVEAIAQEIRLRKGECSKPLESIYLGGGTPSLLNEAELMLIFNHIYSTFEVADGAEITLEANPDDLNEDYLKILNKTPINRLSIGVQSFHDADLHFMHRAHNARQALQCIELAQKYGFRNLTIDLIYGSPSTSDKQWIQNIEKALSLDIPHISAYALTVEPKTTLSYKIKKGIFPKVKESAQQRHFNLLIDYLTSYGYLHYEISNFGKEGFFSRHNTGYWLGRHYIGVGPSAHSFDGKSRSWNVSNNTQYLRSIYNKIRPCEVEYLSLKDQINELTMIGLRTIFGVNLSVFEEHFPHDLIQLWLKQANPLIKEGKLQHYNHTIYLHPKYRFFADGIASELFIL